MDTELAPVHVEALHRAMDAALDALEADRTREGAELATDILERIATMRELVGLTWNKSARYWSIFARLPLYSRGSLTQHRPLHDAVLAGDPAAAEAADYAILERALGEILATFGVPQA